MIYFRFIASCHNISSVCKKTYDTFALADGGTTLPASALCSGKTDSLLNPVTYEFVRTSVSLEHFSVSCSRSSFCLEVRKEKATITGIATARPSAVVYIDTAIPLASN